jgi:hypothetical protein
VQQEQIQYSIQLHLQVAVLERVEIWPLIMVEAADRAEHQLMLEQQAQHHHPDKATQALLQLLQMDHQAAVVEQAQQEALI